MAIRRTDEAATVRGTSSSRSLNVLETEPARRGPDRRADRRITYAGLSVSVGFLLVALASLAVPPAARLGTWLPLHLALAGAAGTAIAAMLPFFVAALAVAPPATARLRWTALFLVAGGAGAGLLGRLPAAGSFEGIAVTGAIAYVLGMVAVGLAAMLPLRHAEGPRRPLSELAYAIALLDVLVGVSLVAMYLAGDPGVTTQWSSLRVAHAWLNLMGFVTLVVAGTLVHFAPTVVGSRIRRRRSGLAAVILLAVAAPAAAIGYAAGTGTLANLLVFIGAATFASGAAMLVVHGLQARRDRAGWTADLDWHRFAGGSLLAAPAWLLVSGILVTVGVLEHGADPQGWRLDRLAPPLVLGFVVQALLGSMSHLLPAVGPGTPATHGTQRTLLGRGASVRLAAWNAGVAVLTLGQVGGQAPLSQAGLGLGLASGTVTLLLLVLALRTTPAGGPAGRPG